MRVRIWPAARVESLKATQGHLKFPPLKEQGMSKIYEALKKAEREKEGVGTDAQSVKSGTVWYTNVSAMEPSSLPQTVIEEYQKMYSALKLNRTEHGTKAILILSSVHGEGTSSVCSQFGRSLVQGGQENILLVDADLRTPTLHHFFNLQRESGLVEFLEGKLSTDQVVKKTDQPTLFVVTAGSPTEDPSRLLDTPRLKEALTEWKRKYTYVIFDSSPALAYADAIILARLLDGAILVVQAGKTRWEVIRKARDTLNNAKVTLLGVVLNKRQYVIPKRIYKRL
jgi:capsular exopolysaccharide synthesis family protein